MTATATKKSTITFYSAHRNLRLVRVPEDVEIVGANQKRKISGVSYQFENHFLTVREGQDVLPDGQEPDTGEPTPQDAVTYLLQHPKRDYPEKGGFSVYEEPVPDASGILAALMQAVADRNADAVTSLYDDEKATFNREAVIEACMNAFTALEPEAPPAA